ncbi:MAG: PLD nuclease N-terminal domain-containing protein [bacterium]|nr:PLD nuclease N-terminal domain-containing protein [bacterium]
METVLSNWKLFLPILILQIGLQIYALIDLIKRSIEEVRGPKILWGIVIIAFQILGVIIYLIFGRRQ